MQNGAPPHFATVVREYLDETVPRDGLAEEAHWNGHHALPTFNPNGLLFWGNVKDNVYGRHPTSIDDLKSFISDEFSNINSQGFLCENVCRSVRSRLRLCVH